jgi:hypothetical protein
MSAEVHDHEHHHKQNFISKYIFSLDQNDCSNIWSLVL